jgi:hypothetical protein
LLRLPLSACSRRTCATHISPAGEIPRSWLKRSIDYGDIERHQANSERTEETLQRVMALIPKEDNGPWGPEQAWAEDATAAVAYAARCLESGRSAESAWAAQRAYEAVDHFVVTENAIDTSKPGAGERILSSALVQAELRRQRRDIDELLAENADVQNLAALAARMRQRAKIDSKTMFAANSERESPA